jgi:uncharacterized cupin superfamily protein
MSTQPVQYAALSPERVEKYSPQETLVKGNPKQAVQLFFDSAEHPVKSGIWEGEPGAYRLAFPASKHEFFYSVEGRVRVIPDGGAASEYGVGDACLLPGGFSGVFEILEAAKKHFVIAG